MSILMQAILLGVAKCLISYINALGGTLYCHRPIIMGMVAGLICGDLTKGIILGGSLEVIFLGSVSIGAYIPPDSSTASLLATALCISTGADVEVAIALAVPVSVVSLGFNSLFSPITPLLARYADHTTAKGNAKGVALVHFGRSILGWPRQFLVIFLPYYFGSEALTAFISWIPQQVIDGMSIASSMLPAMGFAMLMQMILTKKILPYYFLGFVLSAYFKAPVLAVAILGIIIAVTTIQFSPSQKPQEVTVNDDF